MNVLSLFDGMSCGQLALQRIGITNYRYYASEIDKYAIQVTQHNFPNTVQLGDVKAVNADSLPKIDLLLAGSPCQGFSFAGKQLAFDDPRSQLFFEFVRILQECKPKYFILENVRMKREHLDVITEHVGVEPILINSALVSAQNRQRYYWTNIPNVTQPADKGLVLLNIIENDDVVDRDKAHCLDASYYKGGNLHSYFNKHRRQLVFCAKYDLGLDQNQAQTAVCRQVASAIDIKGFESLKRIYSVKGKSPTLTTMTGGHRQPKILQTARGNNKGGIKAENGKTPTISTSAWQVNNHLTFDEGITYRKLTPVECERLQTVPDNYTACVSNTQRYKMLGNGWTVDVIAHILQGIR